ncbi:unnamed protein product [Calypogeia fissa]
MEAGVDMEENAMFQLQGVPKRFSYEELSEATGSFCEKSKLGHGGFGVVYKAELKSGIQVAIKRMNHDATQSQGMKEFKSEVIIISQLSHRNLIKLRGWCADAARKEYMLVYDLLSNGSLDDVLFKSASAEGKTTTTCLSWPQKFKILTGAADGLHYLHQGSNQKVIHRDIKCSNILLDQEWNPKLGDFGIARMVDHHGKAATTDMAGTMGYIAPEFFSEYQFTDKADVFAFGVVILEVACGRRVLPSPSHNMALVQWVRCAQSKGHLLSTVDQSHGDYDTKQMKMVLKVGLLCTESDPQDRPSMKRVVQMLAGDLKVPSMLTNSFASHFSITRNPCIYKIMKTFFMKKVIASRRAQIMSVDSPVKSSGTGSSVNSTPPTLSMAEGKVGFSEQQDFFSEQWEMEEEVHNSQTSSPPVEHDSFADGYYGSHQES